MGGSDLIWGDFISRDVTAKSMLLLFLVFLENLHADFHNSSYSLYACQNKSRLLLLHMLDDTF